MAVHTCGHVCCFMCSRINATCLALSVVLHGAVFWIAPPTQRRPYAIEVVLRTRSVAPKIKKKTLKLNIGTQAPRLGSGAYRHKYRKLGDTILSENYLERLHAHIDPNWRMFVDRTRRVAECTTVLYIDADSNGTVLAAIPVQTTCPSILTQAAIDAVKYCNLLPPPKLLLDKDGILKLEWSFSLKRKT